jgi:hypothetical protein
MDKTVTILVYFITLFTIAAASYGMVGFGVKGHAGATGLTGKDSGKPIVGGGYGVGGIVIISVIDEYFDMQIEPMYAVKKYRDEMDGVLTETKLYYLEMPVLAKFRPFFYKDILTFIAGVYGGWLGGYVTHGIGVKMKKAAFDFGVILGMGLDFKVNDDSVVFDIRFQRGVTSLDWDRDLDIYNISLGVSLAYAWGR